MNTTIELMKNRRTSRSFTETQLTAQELDEIIAAGLNAPSGRGLQSAILVAVQDPETIAKLEDINRAILGKDVNPFFGAKTLIVVMASPEVAHTYWFDGSACAMNIVTAAESLGLSSCCVARAKEGFQTDAGKAFMKEQGIPEHYEGIIHLVIGHRAGEMPEPKECKPNRLFKVL